LIRGRRRGGEARASIVWSWSAGGATGVSTRPLRFSWTVTMSPRRIDNDHGLPLLIGGLCGRFCEWQVGLKRLGSLVRESSAELDVMLTFGPSFPDGPPHCLFTFLGRHACQYCPAFTGPSKTVSDLFQTSS
jgi:hypothetical protein